MQTEMRSRCRGPQQSNFRFCVCHPQKPAEIMKSDLQTAAISLFVMLFHAPAYAVIDYRVSTPAQRRIFWNE